LKCNKRIKGAEIMNVARSMKNEFIEIDNKTAYLVLFSGDKIIIDKENIEMLKPYRWVSGGYYPVTTFKIGGKRMTIPLHHFLATKDIHKKLLKGIMIDHIDGNKGNYTEDNLRYCTRTQNAKNRKLNKNNTTGYKGVRRHKEGYEAKITHDGTIFHLGTYKTPEEAALVRNMMEQSLFREFRRPLVKVQELAQQVGIDA